MFLGLSKAFDTVDHQLLIIKPRSIGTNKNSLKWFNLYLNNRSQVTSIGCTLSAAAPVTAEVPQGSILGSLLFLIYVNDLTKCPIQSDIVIYADNTVLFCSSKNGQDLDHQLNADFSMLIIQFVLFLQEWPRFGSLTKC